MVALMSLITMYQGILFIIICLILCIGNNIYFSYIVSILLYLILFLSIIKYPSIITWHWWERKTWSVLFWNFIIIIISILIYSFIYLKYGLFIVNWTESNLTFLQSLYLSLSTWTNLWYSFIIPTDNIALLTSMEAINWYFYFAFIIAILTFWFSEAILKNKKYLDNLWKYNLYINKSWKMVFSKDDEKNDFRPHINLFPKTWFSSKWFEAESNLGYVLEIKFDIDNSIVLTDKKVNEICSDLNKNLNLNTEKDVTDYMEKAFKRIMEYYFKWTNYYTLSK